MKKEVSQPLIIGAIVIVVILIGLYGYLKLRSPAPDVTPQQTQNARQAQMKMMQDAVMSMRGQQNPGR